MTIPVDPFSSPAALRSALAEINYLADEALATVVYLAAKMQRPLFLEGEPGSGKTELAKALATLAGSALLRLQCYEGIDASQAIYEWDYARQLLYLRLASDRDGAALEEAELFDERFLLRRPLLSALSVPAGSPRPVLLIDEIDRADDEFEAFLLEALAEYRVSLPEFGTVVSENIPIVVLTSNRTRDVHDALKRRSLYHWLEQPSLEAEVAIVRVRAPEVSEALARRVAEAVATLRTLALYKPPGVAETIDWAGALFDLGANELTASLVDQTLGLVVKYREDIARVRAMGLEQLITPVGRESDSR